MPLYLAPLPPVEEGWRYVFIYTARGVRHTWCYNSENDFMHRVESKENRE